MTGANPEARYVDVPYMPFLDDTNINLARFPDYARAAIEPAAVWVVPSLMEIDDPLSILRLYTFDLGWLILPETHKDREGYTFTNVSYYTNDDADVAMSTDLAGVCRSTVSTGFVRQIAGLAHSVCPRLPESIFIGAAKPPVVDLDPTAVMTGQRTVTDEEFLAIIRRYPRLFGMNRDQADGEGTDIEYLLFADMLRFAWVHEWVHGLSGHVRALAERLGLSTLDEREALGDQDDVCLRRAFEFEADGIASQILLMAISRGEDPGRLVDFQDGYAARVALLVLAGAFMTTHWAMVERSRPGEGLRGHPDAALRLLQMWDWAADHLLYSGRPAEHIPTMTHLVAGTVFKLSETMPPVSILRYVVPVAAETPHMKMYRKEMLAYDELLHGLDPPLDRYEMDDSVRDALPHVVPNT